MSWGMEVGEETCPEKNRGCEWVLNVVLGKENPEPKVRKFEI